MLKHFTLVGSLLFLATALVIAGCNWQGLHLSISQHVTLGEASIWIFRCVGAVAAICLGIGLIGFVRRKYHFGDFFVAAAITAALLMASACVFPLTSGLSAQIHQLSSYGAFMVMYVLQIAVVVSLWPVLKWGVRGFCLVGIAYGAFVIAAVLWLPQLFWSYIFVFETLLVGMLFAFVTALCYINVKSGRIKR
jgi:hypothetical protein